jgi:signal transduction histidine kinase
VVFAEKWWRAIRPQTLSGPRLIDATVAVCLWLAMWAELTYREQPGTSATNVLAYVLAIGITVPFAWHRDRPMTALAVSTVALLVYAAGQFVAFPGYGAFALVYGIARHSDRRRALVAFMVSLVALGVSIGFQPAGVATVSTWTSTALALAVAWLTGLNLRARRARWVALEERAQTLEREREDQARRAVAEERLRIARELHDVVAHSLSVIAVQAGVAHHVLDRQPALARPALETVTVTARAALAEMRQLLGVLRQADEPQTGLAPAPGLADLGHLVSQLGEAGLPVDVQVLGDPQPLAPAVDLSAYRIVQESLTNVLRHGGPSARVVIDYPGDAVVVEVRDDGRSHSGPGSAVGVSASGSGHGLIGMRERVAIFGGELLAGPCPDGGYRVRARLPLSPYDAQRADHVTPAGGSR